MSCKSSRNEQPAGEADQGVLLPSLELLASAVSGRIVGVRFATAPDEPAWTDGAMIYLQGAASVEANLHQLCVQCALLAANSVQPEIVQKLLRKPELSRRYLAAEGHRALTVIENVLPPFMHARINRVLAQQSNSPAASLQLALGKTLLAPPPAFFGAIRPRELLAAQQKAGGAASAGQHVPRQQPNKPLEDLPDDANSGEDREEDPSSPVGGGGGLGKLLQQMFESVRRLKGGDSPGADAATHRSRSGPRGGVRSLQSTLKAETVDDAFGKSVGMLYPEWDVHRHAYRDDWCTVQEVDPPTESQATVAWLDGYGLRKPLSRLGMGLKRARRQPQGDDIDIDAAIEAQIETMSGQAPEESYYIESRRQRRDLSVLILLDISGSVTQAAVTGSTVHEQQRRVAATLATVLYEVGDRVALYAFNSQGRASVQLVPVKRFDETLSSVTMRRLHSLIPGAYSRLGAAIRHGGTLLTRRSGTPRKLLVVLSDGLAYDHGYEPIYGAADVRQALAEARQEGIGCLCLSVGSDTDRGVLRRVFGSAAHAMVHKPEQLGQFIGPLFRSALRAAEVHRRLT